MLVAEVLGLSSRSALPSCFSSATETSDEEEGWLPVGVPVHTGVPLGQIRHTGAGPPHTPWVATEERSSPPFGWGMS